MSVEQWSSNTWLVHLADDPQFAEDMASLPQTLAGRKIILDFSDVHIMNSSNIAALLNLRKRLIGADGRMLLCSVRGPVMSAFNVTTLDQVFEYAPDVSTALALLQIDGPRGRTP